MELPFRPCGACHALVPSATGCTHWRRGSTYRDRQRERREATAQRLSAKARVTEELNAFRRMMGLTCSD